MDRGYTPPFDGSKNADRQVERLFTPEFGTQMSRGGWGQCNRSCV